jgi:carbonic anhydrase
MPGGQGVSSVDEAIEGNHAYADGFDKGNAPQSPKKRLVVLTCIDARLHPERFLGLEIGDAHVIRNAGGRASDDALRSLIISSQLLGTRECMVIHHTDCGMLTTNDELRATLGPAAADIDFMPFSDVEKSTIEDVETIRANPLMPADLQVSGWLYDVRDGSLRAVG